MTTCRLADLVRVEGFEDRPLDVARRDFRP
jgi:hypothetical protein